MLHTRNHPRGVLRFWLFWFLSALVVCIWRVFNLTKYTDTFDFFRSWEGNPSTHSTTHTRTGRSRNNQKRTTPSGWLRVCNTLRLLYLLSWSCTKCWLRHSPPFCCLDLLMIIMLFVLTFVFLCFYVINIVCLLLLCCILF